MRALDPHLYTFGRKGARVGEEDLCRQSAWLGRSGTRKWQDTWKRMHASLLRLNLSVWMMRALHPIAALPADPFDQGQRTRSAHEGEELDFPQGW